MKAQIHRSINNIYTAYCNDDDKFYTLRIKGKKLNIDTLEYNPIAVGDYVDFTPYSSNEGLITSRLDRLSSFTRWNAKLERNQTIASNMDQVAIVTCSNSPPFRPRFIDRAIACTINANIIIVMNKCDNLLSEDDFNNFKLFNDVGFKIIATSATTGENIEAFKALLKGKTTAFVGQSGVGKSTLVNTIINPEVKQVTNEVCDKFQRGRHTTNHSLILENNDIKIIDTPGIREILVPLEDERIVLTSFPEFNNNCEYNMCSHLDEINCSVKAQVEKGEVDLARYLSYVRIIESLRERCPSYERNKFRKNK